MKFLKQGVCVFWIYFHSSLSCIPAFMTAAITTADKLLFFYVLLLIGVLFLVLLIVNCLERYLRLNAGATNIGINKLDNMKSNCSLCCQKPQTLFICMARTWLWCKQNTNVLSSYHIKQSYHGWIIVKARVVLQDTARGSVLGNKQPFILEGYQSMQYSPMIQDSNMGLATFTSCGGY